MGFSPKGPSPRDGLAIVSDFEKLVAASGADIWSPDSEKLSAESVRDAHDRGLSVVPWTVNEPKDIDAMRGLGVDGVISDYPKRVLDAAPRGVPSWIPGTLLAVGAIAVIAAGLPIWGVRRSPSAPPG